MIFKIKAMYYVWIYLLTVMIETITMMIFILFEALKFILRFGFCLQRFLSKFFVMACYIIKVF